jgi:GNAT superfamily N-acetyltransferase
MIVRRDGYELDGDRERLDLDAIWGYLRESYWSPGIPRDVVERAIAGSLCLGLYAPDGEQVGFARAISDQATFAWIADVFVLEPHRGRGLGVWLVESLLADPRLASVRATMLATADAHDLYRRFGFESLAEPERWMRLVGASRYGEAAEKLSE